MTTFTDVFSGDTIPPAQYSYATYSLTANATLVWPWNYSGSDSLLADILELSTAAGLTITLPPANNASVGEDILIFNTGAEDFDVVDADSGAVTTISAGVAKYVYIRDNSDAAGTWGVFTYGTGTSAADASQLAGAGLKALSGKLVTYNQYFETSGNYTVVLADRDKVLNFLTGSATVDMPASATVLEGFAVMIRNSSSGNVTVDGSGSEEINGELTFTMAPGESAIFVNSGSDWYTVGYGRSVEFAFSEFVVNAAAGDVALSSDDVSGKMIRVTGTASANIEITLPGIDGIYFVNVEAIGAFTVTWTTGAGLTVEMPQSQTTALYCDGTNVSLAITTALSSSFQLADGTAAAPSGSFLLDSDTGIYRPGSDQFGIALGGAQVMLFDGTTSVLSSDLTISTAAPTLVLADTDDAGVNGVSVNAGVISITVDAAGGIGGSAIDFSVDGATQASIDNTGLIISSAAPTLFFDDTDDAGVNSVSVNAGVMTVDVDSAGAIGSSALNIDVDGSTRAIVDATGVTVTGTAPALLFDDTDDTGINTISVNAGAMTLAVDTGAAVGSSALNVSIDNTTEFTVDGTAVTIPTNNLAFSGTTQRITGDFSNATLANRLALQSSTTNGATGVLAIPNGTSQQALLVACNDSAAANGNILFLDVEASQSVIRTNTIGTGTAHPLRIQNTTGTALSIETNSDVLAALGRIGYGAGAGGSVTQATNKSTGVTLNFPSGRITTNNAALAGGATVSFTLTNSFLNTTCTIGISIISGATAGAYFISASSISSGTANITIRNLTAGSLSEAIIFHFNIIQGSIT